MRIGFSARWIFIIGLLRNGYNFFFLISLHHLCPLNGVYKFFFFLFSCSQMIFNGFCFFRIKRINGHQSRCLAPFTIGICWNMYRCRSVSSCLCATISFMGVYALSSTQPLNSNKSRHFSVAQKSSRD